MCIDVDVLDKLETEGNFLNVTENQQWTLYTVRTTYREALFLNSGRRLRFQAIPLLFNFLPVFLTSAVWQEKEVSV